MRPKSVGSRRLGIVSALIAVSVASTVSACNSSSSDTSGSDKPRIIFVAALVNDSFFITVRCGAQDMAKKLGVDLKFQGPTSADVAAQIKAFKAAAATNPDGMVVAPFSNTGFGGDVRPLMKEGVPVVASGQALEPADALTTVITDYLQSAEQLGPIIGDITGGSGTMAIVASSTGNKTDSDRYTTLVPELQKKYPNLKVLDPQFGNNETAKASTIAAGLIQGNPDLKVVYATTGPLAVGAAAAIKAANVADKVKLVSFDSSPQQIELLKSKDLVATVGQSPYKGGGLSVKAVADYIKKNGKRSGAVKPSAKPTDLPTMLLTPENVNSAEAQLFAYKTKCDGD